VHTLRHAAAVAWLEAGACTSRPWPICSDNSISITGDIYGHTPDATARTAIDGLASALGFSQSFRRCGPPRLENKPMPLLTGVHHVSLPASDQRPVAIGMNGCSVSPPS
jgi:hypothetical protein